MKNGEYLLSTERISRAIAKLALPAVLTTMISMIYNLTDTYFIGLLRDTAQLSAVSIAMPIMWLISAVAGMIGNGAPQLISMKMGAGDSDGAKKCRSFCVFGNLILGLVVTPIGLLTVTPMLKLMNADGAVLAHAKAYLDIIILGSAISSVSGAMQSVMRAGGLATQSSICSVVGIVVNIILDPIFILVFDMGMRGAALATVLGSVASLIVSMFFVRGTISIRSAIPKPADIAQIFKLSLASTISSVITAVTVGASFSMASGFGDNVIPSISVASKVYSLVVSLVSAIAFSLQPFIGYNYASGNTRRLRKGLTAVLGVGTAICLIGTASFLLLGRQYMSLFTADPGIIASGVDMLKYMAVSTPIIALQMSCAAYLSATGQIMKTMITTLGRQIIIFIPVMLIMQALLGLTGLMLAYPVTDIIATILAVILCSGDIASLYKKQPAAA